MSGPTSCGHESSRDFATQNNWTADVGSGSKAAHLFNGRLSAFARCGHGAAALADPKMKVRRAELGTTPFMLSSTDFGKFVAEETEKWAKVIRAANIKPQ